MILLRWVPFGYKKALSEDAYGRYNRFGCCFLIKYFIILKYFLLSSFGLWCPLLKRTGQITSLARYSVCAPKRKKQN